MLTEVDLIWEVKEPQPCTKLTTEATWSRVAVGDMTLVSRSSLRKEDLPVRLPATIKV